MKSLLIFFLLFNLESYAQRSGQVTVERSYLDQLEMAQMGNPCADGIFTSLDQKLGDSYNAYRSKMDVALNNADRAFQNAVDCRSELRQPWNDYQQARGEHLAKRLRQPIAIRQAELAYKKEMLALKRTCTQQAQAANDDYWCRVHWQKEPERCARYQGTQLSPAEGLQALTDLQTAEATERQRCMQHPDNQEQVGIMMEELNLRIAEIETEMNADTLALRIFKENVEAQQDDILKTCNQREELNRWKTAVTSAVAAQGATVAKRRSTLTMLSSATACMGGGAARAPTSTNNDSTKAAF